MEVASIASRGQVTIAAANRKALGLKRGDYLLFELPEGQETTVRVVKGKRLTSLYGSLTARRPFSGKDAIREEVGRSLARENRDKG